MAKPYSNINSEVLEFLEGIPLFSKLNDASLRSLAQAGRFRSIEKGEIVFFQFDQPELVYIVRAGDITITLNSADGRDMVIDEMRAGDIFGYLGALTHKDRSTSAIARKKSEFLIIPSRNFLNLVDTDHIFTRRFLNHIAERLLNSRERESSLAFMDAQARLSRLLLELEKQEKDKGYITISQDELAHRTGLIRQTVAKTLGKWRRNGLLLTGRGRIMLLDHKALQAIETKSLD